MADHSELGSVPHDSWVSGVAFAPDGLVFATASGPVILWDTATRTKHVHLLDPVGVQVTGSRAAVAFSPDGTLVGTAMGLNGYVWRWRSEDLIAEACRRLTRDLTHEEWEHYVGREPYRSTRSPAAASATNV
jgi:WD40 repeat protein